MIDLDVLSLFTTNLCRFFMGTCPEGKCFLVKKLKCKLDTEGDFSISLNEEALRKHINVRAENGIAVGTALQMFLDPQNPDKFVPDLIRESSEWLLKIDKCVVHHERLSVFLEKVSTYKSILHNILTQGSSFGRNCNKSEDIILSTDICMEDPWFLHITECRVYLVTTVLRRLLEETGHSVTLTENYGERQNEAKTHLHVSARSTYDVPEEYIAVPCAPVVNKSAKVINLVAVEYLRHRCAMLRENAVLRHGDEVESDPGWNDYLRRLGEAVVTLNLLGTRPSCPVTISMDWEDPSRTDRTPTFILYNCARLATLRRQFFRMSEDKQYPDLIPFEEVDFSLLVKTDEWELLTSFLLTYPSVLRRSVGHVHEGKPSPSLLCYYLSSLCICFSRYYQRVKILTEPREHMLGVMFARLYLLQGIEQVLHNTLRLFGIEPVDHM